MPDLLKNQGPANVEQLEYLPKIPLLGLDIPAGFPSPARDYIETSLNLSELMILNPASTYFMRVEGCSMSNAYIFDGDLLVIDRLVEPAHNKVVIAVLDGEITVKRLKIINQEYWLFPENDAYKPVKIEQWMDFMVWGVVIWVIHSIT